MDEGVPGGEHAHLGAAMLKHLLDAAFEWTGPRPRRTAQKRRRQGEMAFPAEHDVGDLYRGTRRRAQALHAVLTDSNDGQPASRCGTVARHGINERHAASPYTGGKRGGAAPRGSARGAFRPRSHAFARGAHSRTREPAGPGADRWIRRR